MSLTAQFFISGVEQSHFAEHYQFLVMINPFIAEKAILEKHKIVWKALTMRKNTLTKKRTRW